MVDTTIKPGGPFHLGLKEYATILAIFSACMGVLGWFIEIKIRENTDARFEATQQKISELAERVSAVEARKP